jgi:hypothetical protein
MTSACVVPACQCDRLRVWIVSGGAALFISIGFTWLAELVAHVIGVICPIATGYMSHKKVLDAFSTGRSVV